MHILVTGGAGYIGSHALLRLLRDGHPVTVVDDLSRGHREVITRLEPLGDLRFVEADAGDATQLARVMREREVELVMHFAALAYVGESVKKPLRYYRNNTASVIGLLEAMDDAGVERIVLSSSCATYGEPDADHVPIDETCALEPVNPYGRSKLHVEQIVGDWATARRRDGRDTSWAALRYFNVCGCATDGSLGEDHVPETHLIPICLEAAMGKREAVTIFGTDYPTPDGTCIRDYVHVEDLVDAHVRVMGALGETDAAASLIFNVGVGRGHSVREVVEACRQVTGVDFAVREGARRAGDPPVLYADATRIAETLDWRPAFTELDAMIETAWRWRSAHPEGYRSPMRAV